MTTASEPVAGVPRGAPYYIAGALSAPRRRVGELMAEPRLKSLAWQIVLFCALVSAGAGIASDYYNYSYRGGGTYFLSADHAIADMLIWGAIEFAIFIAGFPLTRFLWSYLFGYRAEDRAVWAATALAMCPLIVLDPLLEIVFLLTGADEGVSPYLVVFFGYALVTAAIVALYYAAALAISYGRAAALSFVNMFIYLVAAIILTTAILMWPIFLSPSVTP